MTEQKKGSLDTLFSACNIIIAQEIRS